jgi:hypothetical protein
MTDTCSETSPTFFGGQVDICDVVGTEEGIVMTFGGGRSDGEAFAAERLAGRREDQRKLEHPAKHDWKLRNAGVLTLRGERREFVADALIRDKSQ